MLSSFSILSLLLETNIIIRIVKACNLFCNCHCGSFQIALVNNFLKLGLYELKLRFRERLTKNLYDQYLQ